MILIMYLAIEKLKQQIFRSSRLRLRLQELIVEKHHHHKSLLRQLNLVELLSV